MKNRQRAMANRRGVEKESLRQEVARLERRVKELQTISSEQLEDNRRLNKVLSERTGTLLSIMEATVEVGVPNEKLYVYGTRLAIERVRWMFGKVAVVIAREQVQKQATDGEHRIAACNEKGMQDEARTTGH